MELINLLFVIASIMFMSLFCVKIYNFEYKITEESSSARGTFRDAEGSIRGDISKLSLQISEMEKNLTTEIACLATKNNEDIKRMGGKFEEWDLIELDENEVLIYSAKPNANGQMVFHCVDKAGKMYTFFGLDKHDAKFLRHTSSPFDEREV